MEKKKCRDCKSHAKVFCSKCFRKLCDTSRGACIIEGHYDLNEKAICTTCFKPEKRINKKVQFNASTKLAH